jgi:hypothetical protein
MRYHANKTALRTSPAKFIHTLSSFCLVRPGGAIQFDRIHPAGTGFIPDLLAFLALEKIRAPEPLEWWQALHEELNEFSPISAIQRASRTGSRA